MGIWSATDTLLDRSIFLGYGNVGLAVRRRLPGWPQDPPRMDGKVVLVTGARSGLGQAACLGFAGLGASIRALGRDAASAQEATERILRKMPDADVRPVHCDVSSLDAISKFARSFAADEPRLDVLVNNAGMMPEERTRSVDGNELMFATHVLAPFALTAALRDLLQRSSPARVINISSGGMYNQAIPGEDLQSDRTGYGPKKLYARTKREQVVITEQWAQRLAGTGIVVHSMHPGWADTEGVRQWMPMFRTVTSPVIRTAAEGADTIVWLGAAPQALERTGCFWHDRRTRPTHYLLGASEDSPEDRQKLWNLCQSLVENAGIPVAS